MDEQNDIRWEQRYDNYHKACARLNEVTDSRAMASLSVLEKEGLIQRFEYCRAGLEGSARPAVIQRL